MVRDLSLSCQSSLVSSVATSARSGLNAVIERVSTRRPEQSPTLSLAHVWLWFGSTRATRIELNRDWRLVVDAIMGLP